MGRPKVDMLDLIDSNINLFMYLTEGIRFGTWKIVTFGTWKIVTFERLNLTSYGYLSYAQTINPLKNHS